MFKRDTKILPILIALLWVLGLNHCFVENVFASSAVEQSDCKSHSQEDPSSHKEGQPCTVKVVSAAPLAIPILAEVIVSLPKQLLSVNTEVETVLMDPTAHEELSKPSDPFLSLSITSNAPPVLA